jgi:predicted metal-dependent phosphoesterase TrpH
MEMASARGLSAVALTDHDTAGGLNQAAGKAAELGLEFIPGIELEAGCGRGLLHILGYWIDPGCDALIALLDCMQADRHARNVEIIARLAGLGIRLDYRDICEDAGQGSVGRPHIADALIRAGAAAGFREVFDRFLGPGGRAFVPLVNPSAAQVIATITTTGGIASLAHPSTLECGSHLELRTFLRRLMDVGLCAIEVTHPAHTAKQSRLFAEMAEQLGLVPTGGSDFHKLGAHSAKGVGFGRVRIPYSILEALSAVPRQPARSAASPRVHQK